MKILVIEDEKHLSTTIVEYFSKQYQMETASNFQDALSKIQNYDYDCILLDITLPDGNGLNILKYLKEDNKTDGVIIISAKDSLEDKIAGLELGADDYLPKPFHLEEGNLMVNLVFRLMI